jgi:hypothetical protein
MRNKVALAAQAVLERARREDEKRRRERREGRKRGELSQSLSEKLRSCNPLQLRRVKKICARYLEDHRLPPNELECDEPRPRVKRTVLISVGLKNRRYRLERRDCGKNCLQCPHHGPYLYFYYRDGSIIKEKYLGKAPFGKAPRKVRAAITQVLATQK